LLTDPLHGGDLEKIETVGLLPSMLESGLVDNLGEVEESTGNSGRGYRGADYSFIRLQLRAMETDTRPAGTAVEAGHVNRSPGSHQTPERCGGEMT
jgi:hypothetical protein